MFNINEEIFNENLLLTQTYCELQLLRANSNIAAVLRSFNPEYGGKDLFSYAYDRCFTTHWNVDPIFDSKQLYNKLFEKQIAHKRENTVEIDHNRLFEGRILVAEVDLTFVDGVSQAESAGLIDANDCPPIDTWFYMSKNKSGRVLYAWIPQRFVQLVNKAIEVNCVECMYWYGDAVPVMDDHPIPEKFQFRSMWSNFVNSLRTTFV